jgi:hypothetical protein
MVGRILHYALLTVQFSAGRHTIMGAERRQTLTRQLQDIAAQQANLATAIARGGELDALRTAPKNAEREKAIRQAELARLDATAGLHDLALVRLRQRMKARPARTFSMSDSTIAAPHQEPPPPEP